MLLVNDVYQYGSRRYRILWRDSSVAYWINIDNSNALPELIRISILQQLLEEESISYTEDPYESFILSPPSKSDWGREIQSSSWAMIAPYVVQEPDIYIRSERGKMIQKMLRSVLTTKQTIYIKLRFYWQRGKSPNALYPDTRNWGGKGKSKRANDKKRGKPRTVSIGTGVNIDENIGKVFRAIIKAHYLTDDGNSIQFAYNKALIALGIDRTKVTEEQLAEAPTYEQFYHFMRKETGVVERARSRAGEIQYQKDMRPVLGTSAAEVMGPGSLYQIDATIGDIYLLAENDRAKIIGRPVIYIVIDVFSRLVTGVYVGLEGPSWVSAMGALANTMMDKVSFCARHGIHIEHDAWPVIGKPEAIIGDKGEMIGRTIEVVSESLHIEIQNPPSYRADWKGIVERHFKTLQETFKPYVQGYVTGVISKKRAGPDYRLDAELTLSDVTKIIINCIIEYNNTHVISDYDADKDMPPELPHNPLALWNWGIQNRSGKLRSVNQDLAAVNLMPHTDATVTEQGIKVFGCLYSTAMAIKEGWFDRINAGPKKVIVAYDPYVTDRIYLRPGGKYDSYIVCELTERSREYRGLTFWDVWRIRKIKAKTAAHAELTKIKGRLSLDAKIEKIVSDAREKNPDTSHLSKTSRTKGIRGNRSSEIDEQRKLQPGLMPKISETQSPDTRGDNVVYLKGQKSSNFEVPDMLDDLYGEDSDE